MRSRWLAALCLLIVCAIGGEAAAYDSDYTHRWIARQAVEYLARAYPGRYDEVLEMMDAIVDGAKHEDDLFFDGDEDPSTVRLMRHFYRPTDEKGLTMDVFGTFINSYEWGGTPNQQNEWGYDDALAAYRRGDRQEAYFALGHVVHLIQDLTVPAHTHLDVHGPPAGDDYEQYCTSMMVSDTESMLPVPADGTPIPNPKDLHELWTMTADASYWRNMYPGDLSDIDEARGVIADMYPSLGWSWLRSTWTIDGVGALDAAFFEHEPGFYYFKSTDQPAMIDRFEFDPYNVFDDNYAPNDAQLAMTERLAADLVPVAVLHSAAAIKMFADEVATFPIEPEPMGSDSGGCNSSGSAPASALAILLIVAGLWRRRTALVVVGALTLSSSAALAHDVQARLSASALDYLEDEIISYFDAPRRLPAFVGEMSCVEIEQRDTELSIDIHSADVSIPEPGVVRLDAEFSAYAEGELYLDNVYLCIGNTTCSDTITVTKAHASVEIVSQTINGKPTAVVRDFQIMADENDVTLEFSGCVLADEANDLLNFLPGFARQVMVDFLGQFLSTRAEDALSGVVDDLLNTDGLFHGYLGFAEMNVDLYELDISTAGIDVGAQMDISTTFPANDCVYDVFDEPEDLVGRAPSLSTDTHMAMALNIGMINDALYHVWRAGFLCLTDDHFRALGAAVDLDLFAGMAPGFPTGTDMDLEVKLIAPPRLRGAANDNLEVTLDVVGASAKLTGVLPNGTVSSIGMVMDAAVTGVVSLDPATSTLTVRATDFDIEYLQIDGYDADTGVLSFDAGRIETLLEDIALPEVFDQIGDYPLTGAVTGLLDYALILRNVSTTDAYLTVAADLFKIPERDTSAPDTAISHAPSGLVAPREARVSVTGTDAELPTELLRYAVEIDGEDSGLSTASEVVVGRYGVSGTYHVSVAAVDLADNVDPSPATVDIEVDGRPPKLAIIGDHSRKSTESEHVIDWTASDDIAEDSELVARVVVLKLSDPTDPMSGKSTGVQELPAGTRSATVNVGAGAIYRVDVIVADTVGNEARSSMFIDTRSASGCSASGTGAAASWLLVLLALCALPLRRRER